jgi:hypothetical protein
MTNPSAPTAGGTGRDARCRFSQQAANGFEVDRFGEMVVEASST